MGITNSGGATVYGVRDRHYQIFSVRFNHFMITAEAVACYFVLIAAGKPDQFSFIHGNSV